MVFTDYTLQIGILNTTCQNRDIRLVLCRWVTFDDEDAVLMEILQWS